MAFCGKIKETCRLKDLFCSRILDAVVRHMLNPLKSRFLDLSCNYIQLQDDLWPMACEQKEHIQFAELGLHRKALLHLLSGIQT